MYIIIGWAYMSAGLLAFGLNFLKNSIGIQYTNILAFFMLILANILAIVFIPKEGWTPELELEVGEDDLLTKRSFKKSNLSYSEHTSTGKGPLVNKLTRTNSLHQKLFSENKMIKP